MKFYYLPLEYVILIHDSIVNLQGGLAGIKDEQQIDSILTHIQNDEYYPDIVDKSTHLVFSLCKFHCFNDGNKRTSLAATKVFLELNGYNLDDFLINMEDIIVNVAKGEIPRDKLKEIMFFYINNKNV